MESTLNIANMWTLSEARVLINALQPHARTFGYHVCLGGGVLNQGSSKKDVDLYFLPLDNQKTETSSNKMLSFLEETWGKSASMIPARKNRFESQIDIHGQRRLTLVEDKSDYPDKDDSVYTAKRKFAYSGLRVDVFILGGGLTGVQQEKPVEPPFEVPPLPDPPNLETINNTYLGLTRNPEVVFRADVQPATPRVTMTYRDYLGQWGLGAGTPAVVDLDLETDYQRFVYTGPQGG